MAAIPTPTGRYGTISPEERRLVSLKTAADMLSVSRSGMHIIATRGNVDFVRIGRRLLITVESIDRYVERLRSDATSAGTRPGPGARQQLGAVPPMSTKGNPSASRR